MKFNLFSIEIEIGYWFRLTVANIEIGNQDRSLLYIEANNGMWKVQFLWLKNDCWIIN